MVNGTNMNDFQRLRMTLDALKATRLGYLTVGDMLEIARIDRQIEDGGFSGGEMLVAIHTLSGILLRAQAFAEEME